MRTPRRSRPSSTARIAGGFLAAGGAVLAVFHGGLLWQRLLDGSLLDPMVAGRWAATLLLVGWLVALRRAGVSLWRGEKASAFWVLVLLLHAVPALAGGVEGIARHGQGLLLVLPAVLASGLLAASLASWVGGRSRPLVALSRRLAEAAIPAPTLRVLGPLAPRAPPV